MEFVRSNLNGRSVALSILSKLKPLERHQTFLKSTASQRHKQTTWNSGILGGGGGAGSGKNKNKNKNNNKPKDNGDKISIKIVEDGWNS